MASSLIHLAVANEVNKTLKRDNRKILLGSIAPDVSKLVETDRNKSHFLSAGESIPHLDWFLVKYKDKLDDDFLMGYYIHLYTDYVWFKYFVPEIVNKNLITKLDGTKVECPSDYLLSLYIYNDYTNLNSLLIDEYSLDLKIFYEELPKIDTKMTEIPIDKLYILVNRTGEIIENSNKKKEYLFNLDNIKQFISMCVEMIISNINEIKP